MITFGEYLKESLDTPTHLFHATAKSSVENILQGGLKPKSYWGTRRIAEYYGLTIEDEGHEVVFISCPLSSFDKNYLKPDYPGIEEPITTVLGTTEEEIHRQWNALDTTEETWMKSLEIIESVVYHRPLKITKDMIL